MTDVARSFGKVDDNREFRVVFALSYPLFLAGAVVARLLPGRRRSAFVPRRSIFAEASALAYRTLPYAF